MVWDKVFDLSVSRFTYDTPHRKWFENHASSFIIRKIAVSILQACLAADFSENVFQIVSQLMVVKSRWFVVE